MILVLKYASVRIKIGYHKSKYFPRVYSEFHCILIQIDISVITTLDIFGDCFEIISVLFFDELLRHRFSVKLINDLYSILICDLFTELSLVIFYF